MQYVEFVPGKFFEKRRKLWLAYKSIHSLSFRMFNLVETGFHYYIYLYSLLFTSDILLFRKIKLLLFNALLSMICIRSRHGKSNVARNNPTRICIS